MVPEGGNSFPCPVCAQNVGNERFCKSCGVELRSLDELAVKERGPRNVTTQTSNEKKEVPIRNRSNKPRLAILLVGAAAVTAGLLLILFGGPNQADFALPRIQDEEAERLIDNATFPEVGEPPKCEFVGKLRGGDEFACDIGSAQGLSYLVSQDGSVGRVSFGGENQAPPGTVDAAEMILSAAWKRSLDESPGGLEFTSFTCDDDGTTFDYACLMSLLSGEVFRIEVDFNSNGTIGRERVISLSASPSAYDAAPNSYESYSPSCDPASPNYNPAQCDGPYDPIGP
jgi:hypothetical protein